MMAEPVYCKCYERMRKVGMTHDDVVYWCSSCGTLKVGLKWSYPKRRGS
jgi:hypothetical protein